MAAAARFVLTDRAEDRTASGREGYRGGDATRLTIIGSVFGASHVRFGAPEAATLGIGIALGLSLLLPIATYSTQFAAAFELWWLAVAAVAIILMSAAGTLLFLRGAVVR